MTDLATTDLRLRALASTINDEYRLANESAASAVMHAIACGEACIEARASVSDGEWTRWCAANLDITAARVARWIRLARNKELFNEEPRSIRSAIRYLATVDQTVDGSNVYVRTPIFDVDQARRLRSAGWSYARIAQEVGVSYSAVRAHLQEGAKATRLQYNNARRARRLAERRALVQRERESAARKIDTDISRLWLRLRNDALNIDKAIIESDDPEFCESLRQAQLALTAAEAAISRALRLK